MQDAEHFGKVVDAVRRFVEFGGDGIVSARSAAANLVAATRGVTADAAGGDPLTPAEARAITALGRAVTLSATGLADAIALDAGYVSRLMKRLEMRGLLSRVRAADDRRRQVLRLTETGLTVFRELERASRARFAAKLEPIAAPARRVLMDALQTVERIVDGDGVVRAVPTAAPAARDEVAASAPEVETPRAFSIDDVVVRPHRVGDFGALLHRQVLTYAEEPGWDATFESHAAEVLLDVYQGFDPKRDGSWIATFGERIVGCAFLVRESTSTARLRMFFVEPDARGRGLGGRLLDELITFARRRGYRRIVLSTTSHLEAARRLYERAGFELVHSVDDVLWGVPTRDETWALGLDD